MDPHGQLPFKLTRDELLEEVCRLRQAIRTTVFRHLNDREKLRRYRLQADRYDARIRELTEATRQLEVSVLREQHRADQLKAECASLRARRETTDDDSA